MMKRYSAIALALILMLLLTGPALAQDGRDRGAPAQLRLLHASPDAPAVNVLINGKFQFRNVIYRQTTPYIWLPADTYNVKVISADKTQAIVIDTNISLEAGKAYTVAAVGMLANIEPLVMEDSTDAPDWGRAKVRLVHTSPDAPAVDVAVKDGDVLFPNVAFKGVTDFKAVDSGSYNLEVRVAGSTDVALDVPWVYLPPGSVSTLVVLGMATTEPALQAQLVIGGEFQRPRWPGMRPPCCFPPPPRWCCGPGFFPPRPPLYPTLPIDRYPMPRYFPDRFYGYGYGW